MARDILRVMKRDTARDAKMASGRLSTSSRIKSMIRGTRNQPRTLVTRTNVLVREGSLMRNTTVAVIVGYLSYLCGSPSTNLVSSHISWVP